MTGVYPGGTVPRSIVGLVGISVLLTGCYYLPVAPGCTAGEALPRNEDIFLVLVLAPEQRTGASFSVDRTGRSQFLAQRTRWALATMGSCQEIPEERARTLQGLWQSTAESRSTSTTTRPDRPYLSIRYIEGDRDYDFFLTPDVNAPSEIVEATALTLHTLEEAYGDRMVREFRLSELETLLHTSSTEADVNPTH